MYAAFSAENIVTETMRDLGISGNFLCALADDIMSPSRLSLWLRGLEHLTDEQTRPLVVTCRDLRAIAGAHAPVPVWFRDVHVWRAILQQYRANQRAQQQAETSLSSK